MISATNVLGHAFLAATIATLVVVSPHAAHASCSEPSTPYCAERFGSFDDQDEFDRCKREMGTYRSEVEEFASCTQRDVRNAIEEVNRKATNDIEEVTDAYSEAVDSFNRRANY